MFYVYELRDPRTGVAFYVGKGQGDRAYQHQREVVNGKATTNPAKIRKIKEILAVGLQVEVAIIAEYDDEADALDHEYHRVESDPTLTNAAPGGSGGSVSPLARAEFSYKAARKLLDRLRCLKERRENELKSPARSAIKKLEARGVLTARHRAEIEEFKARIAEMPVGPGWNGTRRSWKKYGVVINASESVKRVKERIVAAEALVEEKLAAVTKERAKAQRKRAMAA